MGPEEAGGGQESWGPISRPRGQGRPGHSRAPAPTPFLVTMAEGGGGCAHMCVHVQERGEKDTYTFWEPAPHWLVLANNPFCPSG